MNTITSPLLKNRHYDILKWISLIVLPASGTLYFALASVWGLPYGEQVLGTIVALETFSGVLLGLSTKNYSEDLVGDISILQPDEDTMTQTVLIDLIENLDTLPDGKIVRFAVNRTDS